MKSSHVLIALLLLASLCFACAPTAPLPPKAADLNRLGIEALEGGDLPTAEARFALALEYHPRFVDAMVNLGLVELQRGNFTLARSRLGDAVSVNRHVAQPHHGLGVLCERQGSPQDAIAHYLEALAVDPGFVPSRANLARVYFDQGKLEHAREQFLRLTEAAPEAPQGWAGLIETLSRLGRGSEADQVLERANARVGDAPALRLHRARRAMRRADWAQADALLETLLTEPAPLAGAAWAWLGLSQLMQGRAGEAVGSAQRAIALDREDALATYVMAMALSARRDPAAGPWLRKAMTLAPGVGALHYALAHTAIP